MAKSRLHCSAPFIVLSTRTSNKQAPEGDTDGIKADKTDLWEMSESKNAPRTAQQLNFKLNIGAVHANLGFFHAPFILDPAASSKCV